MNVLGRVAETRLFDSVAGALGSRGAVLAYHGVVSDARLVPPLHASRGQLHHQLTTLRQRGYQFLRLAEFAGRLATGRSVARCIAVTFDDAYRGVARLVLPTLKDLGIPVTLFVPTGLVNGEGRTWWDRLDAIVRCMDTEQLAEWASEVCQRQVAAKGAWETVRAHILSAHAGRLDDRLEALLSRAEQAVGVEDDPDLRVMSWCDLEDCVRWEGVDVAPHSVSHPVLPLLGLVNQTEEISRSYGELRSRFERALPMVAYPYGLYDQETERAARRAGMTAGLTMDRTGTRSAEAALFRTPRICCAGATPIGRMGLYLTGFARWYRLRELMNGYPRVPKPV